LTGELTREYQEYLIRDLQSILNGLSTPSQLINLRDVDKKIKSHFRKHWSGLDSTARISAVINSKAVSAMSESIQNTLKDFMQTSFRFMSNYTHPTPYSSIPAFDGGRAFEFHFAKESDSMLEDERILYIAYCAAIELFCIALGEIDGSDLRIFLENRPELTALR
jgi:hypothetical protein